MLLEESLTFPPLLSWLDSHGQTEVRVNFKVNLYESYLKYSTYTTIVDMIGQSQVVGLVSSTLA